MALAVDVTAAAVMASRSHRLACGDGMRCLSCYRLPAAIYPGVARWWRWLVVADASLAAVTG